MRVGARERNRSPLKRAMSNMACDEYECGAIKGELELYLNVKARVLRRGASTKFRLLPLVCMYVRVKSVGCQPPLPDPRPQHHYSVPNAGTIRSLRPRLKEGALWRLVSLHIAWVKHLEIYNQDARNTEQNKTTALWIWRKFIHQ